MEKIDIAELIFFISLIGSVGVGIFIFALVCTGFDLDISGKENKFIKYALLVCIIMCFGWFLLSWYMDANNITTLPLN